MCFELHIRQNELKVTLWASLFLEILFDATRIGIHRRLFGHNVISKNFNKFSMVKSFVNPNTGKKRSQNTTKLCHRSFHESTLKQLQQNFRKYPEKHTSWSSILKKLHYRYISVSDHKGKDVQKEPFVQLSLFRQC